MTILGRFFATQPAPAILAVFLVGLAVGTVLAYVPAFKTHPFTQYPGILAFTGIMAFIGGSAIFIATVFDAKMKLFRAFLWTLAGIAAFPVPYYLLLLTT